MVLLCLVSVFWGRPSNTSFLQITVVLVGSLPGLTSVEATAEDAEEAVEAMAVQEDGSTKLDFFIQAYRAGEFPFYEDYAVHRATEALAGPRQIVVTK